MSAEAAFEIVTLKSGGKSLRSVERGETFHPGIGPVEEARILHVEQQRLRERSQAMGEFVLWDVGLGAAANAIAAVEALRGGNARVSIHSFDLSTAPLDFALTKTEALPYLAPYRELLRTLLHDGQVEVRAGMNWHFHRGNFLTEMERADLPSPHGVLYDPYSPATNCEMWTLGHLARLRQRLGPDCLLTNYTRSTIVRVTFLLAGFFVGAGCGIGEKEETTLFSNRLDRLENPLRKKWLERVRISHSSAPLREAAYSIAPISAADFAALERHPQFQNLGG